MEMSELKQKIVYLHKDFGIPYSFIADKCDITSTHLTLWIKGTKRLSEQTFERVCKYYEEFKMGVAAL